MSTKLDSVCLALVALWDAAVALDGVTVYDGPQVNSDPVAEALFVGHDGGLPDEDTEGALVEQSWMAMGKTKQEDGEITCASVVVRGDTDIATARARAVAIVSAAEDALRVDPLLAGLVMRSEVAVGRYIPMQTDKGAKARVEFTVTYLAQL